MTKKDIRTIIQKFPSLTSFGIGVPYQRRKLTPEEKKKLLEPVS